MHTTSTLAKKSAAGPRRAHLGHLLSIAALAALFVFSTETVLSAAPANSKPPMKSNSVVIIGASYAKGWNPAQVGGLKVINQGAGGEQTHEILARFDKDVLAHAPRAVIIWGFINDIFRSSPEELDSKLVRARENMSNMIGKAQSQGIIPILVTEVTLPGNDGWIDQIAAWIGSVRGKKSYRDQVNAHVMEMNQWVRRVAAEKKLAVLDFEKVLADENGRRKGEYTTQDGTHLSPLAYAALTDSVKQLNLRP